MADQKMIRISKAAKNLNVATSTIIDFLTSKGHEIDSSPNAKLTGVQYSLLEKEYASSIAMKQEAEELTIGKRKQESDDDQLIEDNSSEVDNTTPVEQEVKVEKTSTPPVEEKQKEPEAPIVAEEKEEEGNESSTKLKGLKVLGKIDLDAPKPAAKKDPVKEEKVEKAPEAKVVAETPEKVEEKKEEAPKKVEAKPEEVKPTVKEEQPASTKETKEVVAEVSKKDEEQPVVKQEEVKETKTPVVEAKKEITPEITQKEKVAAIPEEKKEAPSTPIANEPKEKVEEKIPNKNIPPADKKVAEGQDMKEKGKTSSPINKAKEAKNVDKTENKPAAETSGVTPENSGNEEDASVIEAKADKLQGLKVLGKIELPVDKPKKGGKVKPIASSDDARKDKKRKRKRVKMDGSPQSQGGNNNGGGNNSGGNNRNRNQNQGDGNNQNQRRDGNNSDNNRGAKSNQGGNDNKTPQGRDGNNANKAGGNNTGGNNNSNDDRRGGRKGKKGGKRNERREEVSKEAVQQQFKKTLAKMSGGNNQKGNKGKYKKEKKSAANAAREEEMMREMAEASILKVTEFISTQELATLMEVSVNDIIAKCLQLGMFISINQRLDAEAIKLITEDFGFAVDFSTAEEEITIEEVEDEADSLSERAPIVTIMGHVDHGKTSLLDYIRRAKVAEGEAGGITQHIGAYDVKTDSGRRIAFLDTPGHEAFTAMRARGAKVTDVAIIVIAADDSVMPQTIEALNHASVAGVPIVFALNKCDKPQANPNKIKEELANLNYLVEDWGGKYQCYEISAKKGEGIDDLLEGVLLEADVLELKANPDKNAIGTVVEASLDKGRGYVATILVQSGTLKMGSIMLAGSNFGRVKAMTDHRGKRLTKVGPATPVQVLGLNGAPQAGDRFNVLDSEREAREVATKREQIMREQSIRATKRTTLTDIGRRLALGNFHQLNIILKGDVDGSVEALSDSLLKLSTDEVEVNIIHKAVGPLSESDVLLATASDAILIGFQVRPTGSARKLAEKEEVEIRLYSVIYDAINDVRDAMESKLSPDVEEIIVGNAEVRDVFKINRVGTVAGCYITEGHIKRNAKIRLIRDGIVIYGGENGGEIQALKRFKDDVNEVKTGFECGISIKNFNDIKVGDVIETFEEREIKRKL